MENSFATINTQQPATDIPAAIYEPLLSIALHGYDAEDVNVWYQAMLRHVRWRGPQTTQSISNGFDLAATSSMETPSLGFLDTECAARRATLATIDSCISPISKISAVPSTEIPSLSGDITQASQLYNVATHDSMAQAYNTPQSYQTYATTPQQLDSTPEPPQSQQLMASWSPAPSSAAEPDLYTIPTTASLSTGNLVNFAGEAPNNAGAYHWFSATDAGSSSLHTRTRSQQSQLSQHSQSSLPSQMGQLPFQQPQLQPQQPYLSPEYNTQLPMGGGTAMPVLVPYASSSSSSNYKKAAAIPTGPGASLYSSSNGYFPIIHVSSSRRRRKALQKGVKKIVQPLKGRRQQSV